MSQPDREHARDYIPASEEDFQTMLETVGSKDLADLYRHISPEVKFAGALPLPPAEAHENLLDRLGELADMNPARESYIGDGLPNFRQMPIVAEVSAIRNLTTAYTPYQPERSQGTLLCHWIYQCLMRTLTGFEAVNASLYDRSTALFEAACAAVRLKRKSSVVIVSEAIYPGDREVLETLAADTEVEIRWAPRDLSTGRLDLEALRKLVAEAGETLAGIAFPQINDLGLIEDVDALTDLAHEAGVLAIAMIDPILLGTGGLKPPTAYGQAGADIVVGEAQHLALAPNFGGPGLGLFAVRHNSEVPNHVRATPGRYVGKARDGEGRDCRVAVMSTREQHIRKDKATSNICSNQAFIATLAGAALLERGEEGMAAVTAAARERAREAAAALCALEGVELLYPEAPFYNEVTLKLSRPVQEVLRAGREAGLHLGVDVSYRVAGQTNLLKLSFSDLHAESTNLIACFEHLFGPAKKQAALPAIPESALREGATGLPSFGYEEVLAYYRRLGALNVSPDDSPYPLGSCTMKYNPLVNDEAAALPGFTQAHPQAPTEDVQGCLKLLFEIQEWFKGITGLAGLTTQPLAGAQGELVGLKLFQAYHRDHSQHRRDVILIPRSAHGTNFATAAMAGFTPRPGANPKGGIVLLEAGDDGQIDLAQLDQMIALYGDRIAGVMITNPNTSGIFEVNFKAIADKIHAIGGLVYMDGANMNAIAGWVNLGAMGVDAVHNNLHKTWTIPHGGGGPGDAIVAVSERLLPYLPGHQIVQDGSGSYVPIKAPRSIGSFHRHWGNFGHKIRCYTYLLRLGGEGIQRMSATAVLAARYLFERTRGEYATLPAGTAELPRMHEFILTLKPEDFARVEAAGVAKTSIMSSLGKLFLDFGFHAPTVAWPEMLGIMFEPTESYTKAELDRLADATLAILELVREDPELLKRAPLTTPTSRIDEVAANRDLCVSEQLAELPPLPADRVPLDQITAMSIPELAASLREAASV
ncbi:aminomethyl-transferring glycine dehydrogenase subunit GcvPB [Ruficoccus amylovorans]|uniref:glycine dehydrogenase (aminomethyl-transferring) n=1 Tax=Ruficoccus amylovorans TaxID=1804625 RepID=A0A842HGS2_9BACT|nr:aminomethyl-transferring glycine dehydrogenase subunit GcvPB [Ruficoccus amylovorans]MBC2594757.1 aminomethyl-transferring glycine dehydrogenase subunit GcvPB [Ruficoccus amylovorans]